MKYCTHLSQNMFIFPSSYQVHFVPKPNQTLSGVSHLIENVT